MVRSKKTKAKKQSSRQQENYIKNATTKELNNAPGIRFKTNFKEKDLRILRKSPRRSYAPIAVKTELMLYK